MKRAARWAELLEGTAFQEGRPPGHGCVVRTGRTSPTGVCGPSPSWQRLLWSVIFAHFLLVLSYSSWALSTPLPSPPRCPPPHSERLPASLTALPASCPPLPPQSWNCGGIFRSPSSVFRPRGRELALADLSRVLPALVPTKRGCSSFPWTDVSHEGIDMVHFLSKGPGFANAETTQGVLLQSSFGVSLFWLPVELLDVLPRARPIGIRSPVSDSFRPPCPHK